MNNTTIAIVYDFDKTLSRRDMQEDTIFRAYDIDARAFWARAREQSRRRGYDRTLSYLRLLMREEPFLSNPFSPASLRAMAPEIEYYPGVEEYFPMINQFVAQNHYVQKLDIKLEHYLISSGMKEIIEGTSIYEYFKCVYACEFDYENGKPVFPKIVINDTNKTQFIFRINKGMLGLDEDINTHMPEAAKRIPFKNILYIGDGLSDVPSMAVTTQYGGCALAVHDNNPQNVKTCAELVDARRANHMAEADYRENSHLVNIIKLILDKIISNIRYEISAKKHSVRARQHLET